MNFHLSPFKIFYTPKKYQIIFHCVYIKLSKMKLILYGGNFHVNLHLHVWYMNGVMYVCVYDNALQMKISGKLYVERRKLN